MAIGGAGGWYADQLKEKWRQQLVLDIESRGMPADFFKETGDSNN